MGKFSAMMGNCGDVNNTKNAWNMIRSWGQRLFDDNEAEIKKKKRVQQGV
jgi:hypothetical protein